MLEVVDSPTAKLDVLVKKYIELRDQKSVLKKKFDEDTAAIDGALERIEAYFMNQMNSQGLEALPTAEGVPYKQHQTSATVGEWSETLKFIIENKAWELLERRVSKDAVLAYKEAHGDVPPGVNWRERVVVNVRRKS